MKNLDKWKTHGLVIFRMDPEISTPKQKSLHDLSIPINPLGKTGLWDQKNCMRSEGGSQGTHERHAAPFNADKYSGEREVCVKFMRHKGSFAGGEIKKFAEAL